MKPNSPVAIVLVEPQSPGNIGMVCRAMANFGASDLRLVRPCQHLHPEAHKFAVSASPLLGEARVFSDLPSALADLHVTIAATRRKGKLRGEPMHVSHTPELRDELASDERLGLIFGREDSGLTTEEVGLCTHTATIPSDPERGSLNLAQAVLIFLYELTRDRRTMIPSSGERLPQEELETLFRQMEEILARIAFLNTHCPERVMHPLRRIFHKADLDRKELSLLRGIWSQIGWSIRDWQGRKRG